MKRIKKKIRFILEQLRFFRDNGTTATRFRLLQIRENNNSHNWQVYKWICRKYGNYIDSCETTDSIKDEQYNQCIWVCWLQGMDNAPDIVKSCYKSLQKNANGHKVILLDHTNISSFIELPDYIEEKYKRKIIKPAFYCDIIRVALLEKYGGMWIDATVFTTERIPEIYFEQEIFCFKASNLKNDPIKASNWCICAQPNNEIIVKTKNTLLEYWKRENHAIDYYFFHYIFARAVDSNDVTKQMWNSMPYFNNENPHVLQFEMQNKFLEERWEYIKRISPVHKLAYREYELKDSYLAKIINGDLI